MMILDEAFRLEILKLGNEIVLTGKVTNRMPRNTRTRVARELEQHGLIKIIREGEGKALRVIVLKKYKRKRKRE
jgi:hypothetical protein